LLEITDLPGPEALLEMTSDIVTAMVSNNKLSVEELPGLIGSVYASLAGLGQEPAAEAEELQPTGAVSVRKSLANPDVIISMIDGKPYKMLKRHIGLHGYTAATYRAAFGLKSDYPMVAPSYAAKRSELAQSSGLGRKKAEEVPAEAVAEPVTTPAEIVEAPPAKKPRRPRKASATEKQSA
jgi:predicted transcriptional regulator